MQSLEHVASRRLLGEKAAEVRGAQWPLSTPVGRCVDVSQRTAVLSWDAEATTFPSGEKVHAGTQAVCFFSVLRNSGRVSAPSYAMRRTCESHPHDATTFESLDTASPQMESECTPFRQCSSLNSCGHQNRTVRSAEAITKYSPLGAYCTELTESVCAGRVAISAPPRERFQTFTVLSLLAVTSQ